MNPTRYYPRQIKFCPFCGSDSSKLMEMSQTPGNAPHGQIGIQDHIECRSCREEFIVRANTYENILLMAGL